MPGTELFAFAYTTVAEGQPGPARRRELVALHRTIAGSIRSGRVSAAKRAMRDSMDLSWLKAGPEGRA